MGRRRTEIKKIENPQARSVTFSKRRKGLFKKAAELSQLCNVDVAAVVFSPAGKIFEFGNTQLVLDRYLAGSPSSSADSGHGQNCESLLSKIESKLSIDISKFSVTELEEYYGVLEKMRADLLRSLEEKETQRNQFLEGENDLYGHDATITVDCSENQNGGFGLSLEEILSVNNHDDAWMMMKKGDNSNLGMMNAMITVHGRENQNERFGLSLEEILPLNNHKDAWMMAEAGDNSDMGMMNALINVDRYENQSEGFGLSLEKIVSVNNHEDAWKIAEDGDNSDTVITKEELDSLLEELMTVDNNCNQDFGVIDNFSTSGMISC